MEKDIHVGSLIGKYLKEKMVVRQDFAKGYGCDPSTISRRIREKSISTYKLIKLSTLLGYNFFQVIADMIGVAEPAPARLKEMDVLKTENDKLKEEIRVLNRVIEELRK